MAETDQATCDEYWNLVGLGCRCPGCHKPFRYEDDIVLGYDDEYIHRQCVETPKEV